MTDNLMQKLEEKVMSLVAELENLRKELNQLRQESFAFKAEKNHHAKKLQGLVSLLDAVDVRHSTLDFVSGAQDNTANAEVFA